MSKYTKEELQGLIAETRSQLSDLLKSEGKQMPAPAENGGQLGKDEGSPPPKEESSGEASESSGPPAPASDSASAPAPDASASAPAAPAAGAPAPDAAGSAGGAPADLPTLVAAYSQLSPEELSMHVQALQQVMSAQPAAGAPAGAPPPGAAPAGADPMAAAGGMPPGAPAPAGMPPAGPDAVAPMPGEGSKPVDPAMAMKSESDKELLEKLTKAEGNVKNLESSVEKITKAMELMLAKPQRKAVTGKDLAKSAKEVEKVDVTKLTKSQLTAKLSEIARKPELKKSERNLINSFYKGTIKVEALAPLFETK